MRRFVGETLEAFETLFDSAAAGEETVIRAEYPPACDPPCGPLRLRSAAAGGIVVEVERRALPCDDFRLDVLFDVGCLLFSRPSDLRAFWNGPLARAFGMEVEVDPQRRAAAAGGDDDPDAVGDDGPSGGLFEDLRQHLPDSPGAVTAVPARTRPGAPAPVSSPTPTDLAAAIGRHVVGQDAAVARVATLVASQFAKRAPRRPGTVCLIGPTGVGKTATIEALPAALGEAGYGGAAVHRIDCAELATRGDVTRILGCGPGYVGYEEKPLLYQALAKAGCILLLDEFEKAHEDLHDVVLALLDTGRIRTPRGEEIDGSGAVIALTSNAAPDELETLLYRVDPANTGATDRIAREHLRDQGWRPELVGRIGAMAVYEPLEEASLRPAAEQAIREHAAEYGLEVVALDPVLADVVIDLAARSGTGVRGLHHAARDLLAETFAGAARARVFGAVELTPGPPPAVVPV